MTNPGPMINPGPAMTNPGPAMSPRTGPGGLGPLLDERGLLIGLAFDHRDSLDVQLAGVGLGAVEPARIRELKTAILRAVSPSASTVMLDHDYGADAIAGGALRAGTGLVMPLEAQGYAQLGDERHTTLMGEFTAADARRMGAHACKVLVPMRTDRAAFTDSQVTVTRRAIGASHAEGLPIVVEPLVYRTSDETEDGFADRQELLVLQAVAALAAEGPDLLKLPFPTSTRDDDAAEAACAAMAIAASGVPWVLYGAGVPAEVFAWQLRLAGAAGASGFLVGRTVWLDALVGDPLEAGRIAAASCRPRFDGFAAVARAACHPVPKEAR